MREVQLLRSLNHENIVRYYFSWLENAEPVRKRSQDAVSPKAGAKVRTKTNSVNTPYVHLDTIFLLLYRLRINKLFKRII